MGEAEEGKAGKTEVPGEEVGAEVKKVGEMGEKAGEWEMDGEEVAMVGVVGRACRCGKTIP